MKRDRAAARPAVQLVGHGRAVRPPAHLSPEAKRWWRLVLERYELEDQHLRLLQLAAEAWDRAAEARAAFEALRYEPGLEVAEGESYDEWLARLATEWRAHHADDEEAEDEGAPPWSPGA